MADTSINPDTLLPRGMKLAFGPPVIAEREQSADAKKLWAILRNRPDGDLWPIEEPRYDYTESKWIFTCLRMAR